MRSLARSPMGYLDMMMMMMMMMMESKPQQIICTPYHLAKSAIPTNKATQETP
jgi:hypothetical protein